MSEPIFCPCRYGMSGRCEHCDPRLGIELDWQSTPALWMASRKGQCFCEECRYKATVGLGKTKEAATADLLEQEDSRRGDPHDGT